ncbi:MAG: hypothetical protein R6W95_06315 [Desulfosarcina sp.]
MRPASARTAQPSGPADDADCVPVAFPTLHRDFLEGKAVMMGCPKFDDAQSYIDKFAQSFQTAGIKRVTIVVMEVPCCSGLPMIVRKDPPQGPGQTIFIRAVGKFGFACQTLVILLLEAPGFTPLENAGLIHLY